MCAWRNIVLTVDNGWPQGYYPPRISTHESGHILGLPDRRTAL